MKVVLTTGEEFQTSTVFMVKENQICIAFTGIADYNVLRTSLTVDALKEIKEYTDDETFNVHSNFTEFAGAKVTETADGTLDVACYFDREDKTSRRLSFVESALNELILGGI